MQRFAAVGPSPAAPLHRPTAQPWAKQQLQKRPQEAQFKQPQPAASSHPPARRWAGQRRRRRLDCRAHEPGGSAENGAPVNEAGVPDSDDQEQQAAAAQEQPEGAAQPAGAQPGATKPRLWRSMLASCWALVRTALWPLLTVHALADSAVFLLHRLSHRLTNEAAVAVLLGGALTPAAIGNMWWLSADPALANFHTGYQPLTFLFFLLTFPLVVAVKSGATLATILLCQQAQERAQQQQAGDGAGGAAPRWRQPVRGLRHGLSQLAALGPQVAPLYRRMYFVELLVASAVVPLTFASLAVVTLPLTLPVILNLQAATTAAVAEGLSGMAALRRSQQLVRPVRWQLAVPFVGLVAARRLLENARAAAMQAMPPRYYQELVEIPLVVLVGGTLLSLLLARLSDVLPFVAYTTAAAAERDGKSPSDSNGAAVAGGSSSGSAAGQPSPSQPPA